MLLTKASEYALLSLIIIAKKNSPQDVETLSTELAISKSFLAKILQALAKNGILKSFKGTKGGFLLAKDAEHLTLKDIIEAAEKRPTKVFECSTPESQCPSGKDEFCKILPVLTKLQKKIDHFLDDLTLKDIIES
ncbi:RrF2 family transcriptional regulator [Sulfurospirillum sp. 1612]|uniref:RrF2 family transcriptional regulator n=1 Tax=Sulfurospirillum sp. 1612 TaxID=3094835 RepID=UPI002F95F5D3